MKQEQDLRDAAENSAQGRNPRPRWPPNHATPYQSDDRGQEAWPKETCRHIWCPVFRHRLGNQKACDMGHPKAPPIQIELYSTNRRASLVDDGFDWVPWPRSRGHAHAALHMPTQAWAWHPPTSARLPRRLPLGGRPESCWGTWIRSVRRRRRGKGPGRRRRRRPER